MYLSVRVIYQTKKVKAICDVSQFDKTLDAWLLIRRNNGTTTDLHLGMFPYGGAPKTVYLTSEQGTNIVSMKLTID